MGIEGSLRRMDVPEDRPRERLDVRGLKPPEPLTNCLERLAELDDDVVLVQITDRTPQHLYPKLDDRGYRYETKEEGDATITVIWRPE